MRTAREPYIALTLLLLSAITVPVSAATPSLELLAETSLPGDLEVDRTLVGGLSGLTYDPGCDLFYAVSDDRGRIDPPRFYSLKIGFDGNRAEARVVGATLLRDTDGAPFARGDLDPEALALAADGALYLASEGVPHRGIAPLVARFRLDGSISGSQRLPEHYLPADGGTRGVRDNFGFEGLAVSADGTRLFVAAENALLQDGPIADLDRGSPTRVLVLDLQSGRPLSEYLYEVGPVQEVPDPPNAFRTKGISEILALDNQRLLVVERSFSAGVGNRVEIFLVDLRSATDISGVDSLLDHPAPKPVPLTKTLVADLTKLGIEPDNIEGMALGPVLEDGRRLLVLISDNNFQPSVQSNQIVILAASGVTAPRVVRPEAAIHEIQGAGHISPLVGRCVSRVEGLVTVTLGSRGGQAFWIQDPTGDGDPSTSEGLFVTAVEGLPRVEVGDQVRLEGRVEERSWGLELPVTRLFATAVEVGERAESGPPPVVIGQGGLQIPQPDVASDRFEFFDPGRFAADAFESLEGMLVRVREPVVVGPTSRFGELVVMPDSGRRTGVRTARGGARLLEDNVNPQRIVIDDRLVEGPPGVWVGDTFEGPVDGVLHYSFGSYKVLNNTELPKAHHDDPAPERTMLVGDDVHVTVATLNLENLSAVSNEHKFERLALVVAENLGSPDIVVVQEVQDDTGPEDDGTVSSERTLELLVEAIENAGGPGYETRWIDPADGADGGQPGANIRTAFLFNPARVDFVDRSSCPESSRSTVDDGAILTCSPGLVNPDHPVFRARGDGRGGSRKPLVGEFSFGGRSFVVINLHLASKVGDDPIFGRRQPRVESSTAHRAEQAMVVADFVRKVAQADPSRPVIVLGDLNDVENSQPLLKLEAAGLENLVERLPLEERYSFVYLGNSQILDHILVSEWLTRDAEVEIVHVNADAPADDRASDHDPVIARLSFER